MDAEAARSARNEAGGVAGPGVRRSDVRRRD